MDRTEHPAGAVAPEHDEVVEVEALAVEGWALARVGDEEPRIEDEELGRRLGYRRPRDVRKLVDRLVRAGILDEETLCATVAQTGGRPATVYYLTEAQALKVAAHSETAPADALLDEMIRVFMLARRGALPAVEAPPLDAPTILASLAALDARVAALVLRLAKAPERREPIRRGGIFRSLDGGVMGPAVYIGPDGHPSAAVAP